MLWHHPQKSELGRLFENSQKGTAMRTYLQEMFQQQPLTPVAIENTAAESIANGTAKQKRSRSIEMICYWVRHRI